MRLFGCEVPTQFRAKWKVQGMDELSMMIILCFRFVEPGDLGVFIVGPLFMRLVWRIVVYIVIYPRVCHFS